ncbi:DEAD/DEAH box helicase [Ruegeria pomeroyi]|uniref:ATP-dependent RNA helicase, DEAD/DEAH box family n=2 Tax=Ruegeria pomeroyi TaxID=89184 RepID=Q5LLT8_RUEPO|nr:DEAD/DEAH box helicase [Ruegeria pomeroyi]AAV97047.2 ATP-dependent RNA helicase, DEAD/DEAH box family [Ruegeria pomeroyi DSS-3]NVK99525.1 DEAD/DEAH box helicase [Ruegeria pomeroyi]NVL00231.1 DEAD/DEAH box helicase [Ruegeria pomeroyi]QWV10571.1 DEAD/DEAH box helicase [Ruegeria pomeroyi]
MTSPLLDALAERGFDTLTDVQQAVTDPELASADLLVSARTGSGKTVGFGLAIAPTLLGEAETLGPPAAPLALIVAPTRELALQVSRELTWLFAKAGGRIATCIGGMDARTERRTLERGAHIVVGTPGRLRDHITRGALDLADIRAVVLDEADEMLDLGFREDLEFMLGEAPEDRRTLLFSATVSPAIAELAKTYQRQAARISTLGGERQHSDISYQAVQVSGGDGEHAIINLLRFHDAPTAIVFANTRAAVARLTARLANRGFAVVSLSGELSQDERSHALQAMRDGRARVCVATDVAARGIDLPNLDLVIHADLPTNTEGLLHRSGRTGRAGRKGISALIVPDKISKKASRLLKWAKIEAEWTQAPTPEDILAKDEARLLADPLWTDPVEDEETRIAAGLMEQFTAQQIAVACLRLYRAKLTAPEELNQPPARGAPSVAASFGPSRWISLSVGREQRAEPRWLLPLLCRAGNLEKSQIGKITMQAQETHVELAEAAVQGFLDQIGPSGVVEGEITARLLDGVPEMTRGPQGKPRPRSDRPAAKPFKPAKPRHKADRDSAAPAAEPRPFREREATPAPAKPRRAREDGADRPAKPARATLHAGKSEKPYKPRKPASGPGVKPSSKPGGKPSDKPGGKPWAKPGAKPGVKPGGKKPGGKPTAGASRPAAGRPGGEAPPKRKRD